MMSKSIGFFEVDGRELAQCGDCLDFVPRALRFQKKLEHLESHASKSGAPFVYTICCADRFLEPARQAASVVVPRDESATGWMAQLSGAKRIHLEKPRECGNYAMDDQLRVWDMFLHNPNAPRLFEQLGIRHWVVYGIGIDHCVSSAAKGLLQLGYDVTVLSDVIVPNAGGNDATKLAMLATLVERGARVQAYEDFVAGNL